MVGSCDRVLNPNVTPTPPTSAIARAASPMQRGQAATAASGDRPSARGESRHWSAPVWCDAD